MDSKEEWSFPGLHIQAENKHKAEIEYTITPDDDEVFCPVCEIKCSKYGNRNPRRVQDLSKRDGARVFLAIEAKRYKCTNCMSTRTHPTVAALIRGRSSITNRLADKIKEESLLYNPKLLESEYGISDKTINNLTAEYLKEREDDWKYYTPKRLGMFSLFVGKRYRTLFFDLDLTDYGIVDFLESAKEESLRQFFEGKEDLNNVKTAIIAPHEDHRKMINEFCPKSTVILDISAVKSALDYATEEEIKKFHMLQDYEKVKAAILNQPLTGRNRIVEKACDSDLRFSEFCDRKKQLDELFQHIVDHDRAGIDQWIYRIASHYFPDGRFTYYSDFVRMVKTFEKEISNSTQYRYQTDYAQQTMNLASTLQKCGNGYKFKNLRARVLFAPRKRIKQQGTKDSIQYMPSGRYAMLLKTFFYTSEIKKENVVGNYVSLEDVIITQLLAQKRMEIGIHKCMEEDDYWEEAWIRDMLPDVLPDVYRSNHPNSNRNYG